MNFLLFDCFGKNDFILFPTDSEGEDLNLSEFGHSWDGSMVSDDENSDADSLEACIPQFDGPIDEKPAGKIRMVFFKFFYLFLRQNEN